VRLIRHAFAAKSSDRRSKPARAYCFRCPGNFSSPGDLGRAVPGNRRRNRWLAPSARSDLYCRTGHPDLNGHSPDSRRLWRDFGPLRASIATRFARDGRCRRPKRRIARPAGLKRDAALFTGRPKSKGGYHHRPATRVLEAGAPSGQTGTSGSFGPARRLQERPLTAGGDRACRRRRSTRSGCRAPSPRPAGRQQAARNRASPQAISAR
jgi:hypothetical protein